MSIETELNQYYRIINVPNDELDGIIGKCEGYYGMDKAFSVIRLQRRLSSGERSLVITNACLELIENYQPPTVDYVKQPDTWC